MMIRIADDYDDIAARLTEIAQARQIGAAIVAAVGVEAERQQRLEAERSELIARLEAAREDR